MVRTIAPLGRVSLEGQWLPASDVFVPARRRLLVRVLSDREPGSRVELDDLAREIAIRECDGESAGICQEAYERILVDLHESHLPRLSDAALLDVERDDGIYVRPNVPALAAV